MKNFLRITACAGIFVCLLTGISLADPSRVLSDDELDQIYAGGLNLDFDNILGSMSTIMDTASNSSSVDIPRILQSSGSSDDSNSQTAFSGFKALESVTPRSSATGRSQGPNASAGAAVPRVLDVVAGKQGGKFTIGVSEGSQAAANGAPVFQVSNSGTQNFLNVTDTAQQNLQALVNVNAAGSVVPIQLNLTILINSNVQNLNNLNVLDLNNFSTFQF